MEKLSNLGCGGVACCRWPDEIFEIIRTLTEWRPVKHLCKVSRIRWSLYLLWMELRLYHGFLISKHLISIKATFVDRRDT
jgi:hypothetical protein